MANDKNLTLLETLALGYEFNLRDAHTHQGQSPSQTNIIARLPDIFRDAETRKQHDLDNAVTSAFLKLCSQQVAVEIGGTLICYSSSLAMEIVANYLRRYQLSVTLIEPTFDNIADILKRHGIQLNPLEDEVVRYGDLETLLHDLKTDAIFLTLPNNPTGTYLSEERFETVVRHCVEQGKLLILDTSFRLFEPNFCFDQYRLLNLYQPRYIVIEDTGKIWPTLDLKVGFINTSPGLYDDLKAIHSDFLLNVSPFILRLLLEYFEDSNNDNFSSIRDLVLRNRQILRQELQTTILTPAYNTSNVSVEFLHIDSAQIRASELHAQLEARGIYVLPGTYFFWNTPEKGEHFIRIALARDSKTFEKAASFLRKNLLDLTGAT